MDIVNSVKELKEKIDAFRNENKTVGLVPTMGALHKGHASLVSRSVNENDVTVVSVFVNPTQFNDKNDLENRAQQLFLRLQQKRFTQNLTLVLSVILQQTA